MKGDDIAARLLGLATLSVELARRLPHDVAGRHVGSQLLRAGTAGAAHYEEARAAESRADFIHKAAVAAKEVRETVYWLELVRKTALADVPEAYVREAGELRAILQACVRTAKSRSE